MKKINNREIKNQLKIKKKYFATKYINAIKYLYKHFTCT